MGLRTIEQKINAGHQFDGTAPTGTVVNEFNMERYPAQNAGGLFDFGNAAPIKIEQIFIVFGGQSAWSLTLVDADNSAVVVLLSGTTETYLANTTLDLYLLQGQKLKLTTTGATTAMKARISLHSHIHS